MTPSKQAITLIQTDVAYRPVAYRKDGKYRIGYEHEGPDVHPGDSITKDRAEALLKADLEVIGKTLDKHFREVPPIKNSRLNPALARQFPGMTPTCDRQSMFDALVALAFHIGVQPLVKSSLWKALLESADEDTIRAEFERWVYEDGKPKPEHVARRQHEADHFFGVQGE